jgi:hypothetical protein
MTQQNFKSEDVLGIEPKHLTYVRAQDGSNHDMLVVKEMIHLKDGRRIPNLRFKEDYKRPYWITHKGRQTHKDKKDYELEKNCQKYTCTQLELPKAVARALGDYSAGPNPPLRRLGRSPYLYGTDITSAALYKAEYRNRWPGLISLNKVAAGDIETNVHSKEGEIICASVTCKRNARLFYLRSWVADIADPVAETHAKAREHIGEWLDKRQLQLEVFVVDTPAEIVIGMLNALHEWQPEFFTFWNMDFDITNMVRTLERANIDPATVFSDPRVPAQYRYFEYRRGQSQKVTASGKTMSINIEDRWNWVTHPASFQCIDALPVYRLLRLTDGKDSSYALDYILQKELKITKLKFAATAHLSGLRWHEVMQEKYKIEYGVYNVFDSISLELLDEKTNDLASKITTSSKNSDYKNFNSNPKRLCDDMHFWYLNRPEPCVIGSSSDQMVDELDEHVIGHDDWIVTLPSFMAGPTGLPCVKEYPDYRTLIFAHVADLDIVSTYPNVSQLLNIARETCMMEFSRMQGISEHHRREVGVNLTGGRVNAVEICQKILGAPSLDQLLAGFEEHVLKKPATASNDAEATNALPRAIGDSRL